MIQSKLLGVMFIILAVLASYFATFKYGQHVEFLKQENIRKDVVIKANAENEAVKLELQETRQNAEAALNIILATPAPRVRVPICPSGESNATDRGEIPATTGERTYTDRQRLLDEAGRHLESKSAEWSRALNACKVVMEWANQSR